ncbi:MAG: CbiX/SirB N-terminal domain-containing protein [Rhodocyclaceae bacterium]
MRSPDSALILFGHGARDPDWARPMERLCDAVRLRTTQDVRLAFLEFMTPSLGECIDQLVADGARHIDIVPVFLAQGGHVRREVPHILAQAEQRHPGLTLHLRAALGETPAVIEAMAAVVVAEDGA